MGKGQDMNYQKGFSLYATNFVPVVDKKKIDNFNKNISS